MEASLRRRRLHGGHTALTRAGCGCKADRLTRRHGGGIPDPRTLGAPPRRAGAGASGRAPAGAARRAATARRGAADRGLADRGAVGQGEANSLQVTVSRARRDLGPLADRLTTESGGYRLRVEPGELDADRFAAGYEEGRALLPRGAPTRRRRRSAKRSRCGAARSWASSATRRSRRPTSGAWRNSACWRSRSASRPTSRAASTRRSRAS